MLTHLGLNIVSHPLALEVRTEFKVAQWGLVRKRRRNWRVLRIEISRPGCYQSGNTLYVHPDLVEQLTLQLGGGR